MPAPLLSSEQIELAKKLAREGWSTTRIAEQFGCHPQTIRRATDERYRQDTIRRVQMNRMPDIHEPAVHTIPRDTRSLTGRLMGDPLPGRSSLDRGY